VGILSPELSPVSEKQYIGLKPTWQEIVDFPQSRSGLDRALSLPVENPEAASSTGSEITCRRT
jgi:hypothetical protein